MPKFLSDFKQFVLRGNVVDLAVGLVIGAAFQSVVKAFVSDILTPIITIPSSSDFFKFAPQIHGSTFQIGDFINATISFIILAAVVFFFVVRPINLLMTFGKKIHPGDLTNRECPECLSSIPIKARRCSYCTAPVEPLTATSPATAVQ